MIDFCNPGGIECMIMDSDAAADRVIALFESAAAQGFNPIEVETEVYRQAGVDPVIFNTLDRDKIRKAVNNIWCRG